MNCSLLIDCLSCILHACYWFGLRNGQTFCVKSPSNVVGHLLYSVEPETKECPKMESMTEGEAGTVSNVSANIMLGLSSLSLLVSLATFMLVILLLKIMWSKGLNKQPMVSNEDDGVKSSIVFKQDTGLHNPHYYSVPGFHPSGESDEARDRRNRIRTELYELRELHVNAAKSAVVTIPLNAPLYENEENYYDSLSMYE